MHKVGWSWVKQGGLRSPRAKSLGYLFQHMCPPLDAKAAPCGYPVTYEFAGKFPNF